MTFEGSNKCRESCSQGGTMLRLSANMNPLNLSLWFHWEGALFSAAVVIAILLAKYYILPLALSHT